MGAITIDQVTGPDPHVDAVLARHHALMRSQSPEESCHVMTSDELRASGAHLFAAKLEGSVVAVGAFKALDETSVELKSMHTLAEARGQGLGKVMVQHLLDEALKSGATQAYLETGSDENFAPARALYERLGFSYVAPFGDYCEDPLSVFMLRAL